MSLRFGLSAGNALVAILLAVTVLLVVAPLTLLLLASFKPAGTLPWDAAPLTVRNFTTVVGDPATFRLLANTLLYVAGSVALACSLGLLLGWLVERTDVPLRRAVYVAQAVALGLPPMITALGWTLWLSPRIGLANLVLRFLLRWEGGDGPLDGYSLSGMIFVTGLAICPSVFFMLCPLLARMDPSLEEAAQVAGGRTGAVWRRVMLPLLLPGILSVVIYYAVAVSQHFDVPLALGLPSRTLVLSTRVFLLTQPANGVPDYGLAAAYALITLVFGVLLIGLFMRLSRRAESFQVITGRGYRPRRMRLGPWRYPALGVVVGYLLVALAAPLLLLLWVSLLPYYQAPSVDALRSVSFSAYGAIVHNPRLIAAVGNTVLLLVAAATIVVGLSVLIAWVCVRQRSRASRVLEGLAFSPLAIPHVLIALGVLLLYARTPIYGTVGVLLLGQATAYLAFGNRSMIAALMQINRELEESAAVHGANRRQVLSRIVVPLLKPAVANGWLWVATHSVRDFTFPLMLGTTSNVVIATLIWNLWSAPNLPGAAALSVLLALVLGLAAGLTRALIAPGPAAGV